jgi:hypothetical protein
MPKISVLPTNSDLSLDDELVVVDRRTPRSATTRAPIQGLLNFLVDEIGEASASGSGLLSIQFWTDLTNATHSPVNSTLVKRDASGRFQAAAPSSSADVTTKGYVDSAIQVLEDNAIKIFKQTITGSVTNFNINHNFGTRDVVVQIYDVSTNDTIMADVVRSSINQVQITLSSAPGSSSFRVLVQG